MYYWAIKKMETLLTFVTAIGMLLFLLGQTANAQEKGIKPTVRIELSGERTKTLSSPLRIKGKFKTENFAISYLPIEKIESLAKSINQTGFWDNILARKKNGKIQIAYGHHRLSR